MNKLMTVSLVLLASCALAQDVARPSAEELKAQRAERRIKAMNETGGFIADSRYASGKFVFVNLQSSVDDSVIVEAAAKCQNSCLVLTTVEKDQKKVDISTARAEVIRRRANMATFLIEDDAYPMTLQCPEERWAIINIKALKKDGPSKEVLGVRVKKMMTRTLAMMFQSGYSVSPLSTVQVIDSLADLDAIKTEGVATDCQTVVQQTASKFGFKPMRRVFYRKALEEGWAPEPVSEIQRNCKALWEQQCKGEPTAPLKISYDKDKGGQVK